MSIRALLTPINLVRATESVNVRTPQSTDPLVFPLVLLASAATLGISAAPSATTRLYEFGAFLSACVLAMRPNAAYRRLRPMDVVIGAALTLWGFGQLAVGATEYRFATFDAALRAASLGATLVCAFRVFDSQQARSAFITALAWFGFVISVVAILAYLTSPGKILWFFDSPFPDSWGPFLSRNNFAQFLELTMPAALWLGLSRRKRATPPYVYVLLAAFMLAAGVASASRAGVLLLIVETVFAFWISKNKRLVLWFLLAATLLSTIAGASVVAGRFAAADPLQFRREIFRATISMISARPWQGYGLGNYSVVYSEFAEFDSGAFVEHAHNDWLEWTAEGGLLYTVVWVILAARLLLPSIRSIWGIGVPALFLHALVDYPFARLGISAWVFLLAGAILAAERDLSLRKPPGLRHYVKGAET
jgi:O-antigen ligase